MKLFRKQIKITNKCRHVTVQKQKIEQQPEPSWEGPHEKSLLWPGVRSAYRSYTDFPCQQVLEAWVSGKSANLNHHFWLQKSEKKLSLQQVFTSLQNRRRETPLKKQDFFSQAAPAGPKVKLRHLCFGFASTSVSPPPGPSSQTEKFGKNPQVISKSFLVSMQICN